MDAERVGDRDAFLDFVTAMRGELHNGAESWENVDLATFLEAMAAWVRDWQGPFDANPWKHAAALLQAGAFYE